MSIEQGIFIRGKLRGTKNDSFTNRQTGEVYPFTALGIDLPFTNSFGIRSFITKEVRISKDKLKDSSFMKTLNESFEKYVELEISIGDFKNLFVSNNCVITVLSEEKLRAAS